MKFTSKLALTSLILALGATSSALADSHADVAALVAKSNSLTAEQQALGNFEAGALDFYKSQLDFPAYTEADSAGKVAYVQQLLDNATKYVQEAEAKGQPVVNDEKYDEAKKIVDNFAEPAKVPENYKKLVRSIEVENELANTTSDLYFRIYTNPSKETLSNLRTLNLVNAQQHLNLVSTIAQQDGRGAFASLEGALVAGDGAKASNNQLVAGYKYEIPYLPFAGKATVAGFGELVLAQGSVSGSSTNKLNPAAGLGLYADYSFLGARVAVLGAANSTTAKVSNSADFRAEAAQLASPTQASWVEAFAKYSMEASAKLQNYTTAVKVDYTYIPMPKFTVTPGLVYQYNVQRVSQTETKLIEAAPAFVQAFDIILPYEPVFQDQTAHRWGATLDVTYQAQPNLLVGGDAAVIYSTEKLGTRFVYTIVKDHHMPEFSGKEYNSSSMTYAVNAKATYNLRPDVDVTAKAGFVYLSDVKQSGASYGLNLNYRF